MSASGDLLRSGAEISSAPYLLDAEAALAYGSAVEGPPRRHPPRNIHTDAEAARQAGFSAPIAGGEQTFAVMAQLLVDRFDIRFLKGGRIEVAFLKPVLFGDTIIAHARTESVGADSVELQLWVENQHGERVLAGTASVRSREG